MRRLSGNRQEKKLIIKLNLKSLNIALGSMKPSEILKNNVNKIKELMAKYPDLEISNVRVFGSIVRGEDHEGSDIDLLISSPVKRSLFRRMGLQQEISEALGVEVDLLTEQELKGAIKHILYEAVPLDLLSVKIEK